MAKRGGFPGGGMPGGGMPGGFDAAAGAPNAGFAPPNVPPPHPNMRSAGAADNLTPLLRRWKRL